MTHYPAQPYPYAQAQAGSMHPQVGPHPAYSGPSYGAPAYPGPAYPAHQPAPGYAAHAPQPYAGQPQAPVGYPHAGFQPAMPFAPPPAPYAYAQPYAPPAPAPDAFEQRLRAYGQAETAVAAVPRSDDRILKVIDAAVRSTENKTAAAIDALATLMDRQQKAQQAHQPKPGDGAEVAQVLATLAARMEGLEKSLGGASAAKNEEALAHARQLEDRIGSALEAISAAQERQAAAAARPVQATEPMATPQHETVTFEAANDVANLAESVPAAAVGDSWQAQPQPQMYPGSHDAVSGVRPPPRTHARPRITVPRASIAVAEITARQRLLDAGEPAMRDDGDSPALDAIRRSIAALADQVRETSRMRERRSESDLRQDIKELQRSVQDLAPRQIVAAMDDSIKLLARKIEQSRDEGMRESQLAPIEALLGEVRSNLMEMREPRVLNGVNETLTLLARRIEAMDERSADASQLDEIQRQMAEMRSIVADARRDQPFEALSAQFTLLSDKLDEAAERPRDTRAMLTLAEAVEDVRRAIRKLDPDAMLAKLEKRLAGLDGLEQRLDALSRRLDEKGNVEIVSTGLDSLTDRIEQMTKALAQRDTAQDLTPILERIDAVHDSIERRPVPADSGTMEKILRRLADRIDTVQAPGQTGALDELQAQMSSLADRLDRAIPSDPALGGLERTLNDLCQKVASLEDTTARAVGPADPAMDSLAAEGMMLIKRDLTDMRSAQVEADTRSHNVLGQVNATLEKIVARLAALETETARPQAMPASAPAYTPAVGLPQAPTRAAPQAAAPQAPVQTAPLAQASAPPVPMPPATMPNAALANTGRSAPTLARQPEIPAAPRAEPRRIEPPAAVAAAPVAPPMPKASSADQDLDLPLEPGGRSPLADSLGPSNSEARSAFIAAARRAAQAAQEEAAVALAESQSKSAGSFLQAANFDRVRSAIGARRKPLLLGLAAVIVAVGGLKVATQFLDNDPAPAAPVQQAAVEPVPATVAAPALEAPREGTDAAATPATEQVAIAPAPRAIPMTSEPAAPSTQPATPVASAPAVDAAQPAGDVAALMAAMSYIPPEKLKQAALSGNASAAYEIGARLAEARGGAARDLKNAARWMEIAANQGLPLAQYRLGSFHREGLGVAKDGPTAFSLFRKAAEQGNILAMHNLAVMYAEGVNGAADYGAAAQWFRNAAEHGVKDSQFNIGVLYLQGLGIGPDPVEAYKWFAAAARQGDQEAVKRRDATLAKIPAARQEAARQLGENFRARRADTRANELVVPEGGWDDKRLPSLLKRPKAT